LIARVLEPLAAFESFFLLSFFMPVPDCLKRQGAIGLSTLAAFVDSLPYRLGVERLGAEADSFGFCSSLR